MGEMEGEIGGFWGILDEMFPHCFPIGGSEILFGGL